MATIFAVCKDPGGAGNLLPILPVLRSAGHKVKLFLHEGGKGGASIKALGEKYEAPSVAEEIIEKHGQPDLVVTSMCSGGGIGRSLVSIMRRKGVPTVALQDFWGARIKTDWYEPEHRPDLICVNDKVGADIIKNIWGKDGRTKIAVTGYPSLDAIAKSPPTQMGREMLGVTDDLPIVLYPGQISHAGKMFLELVEALADCGIPCHLIATRHGRMEEAGEEEMLSWKKAEGRFPWKLHASVDFSMILDFISASRVVVGMYSTIQIQAAALRRQVASILYPKYGMSSFIAETGGIMQEFPLVTLGCSAKATNAKELRDILNTALVGDLGLVREQEKAFRLDGKNAERTVKVVLSLLD